MSLKDKFDRFIDYFAEDGEEVVTSMPESQPQAVNQTSVAPVPKPTPAPEKHPTRPVTNAQPAKVTSPEKPKSSGTENITRLHARQQELAAHNGVKEKKVTIDVRYPKKYEEATEIVDLLIANESILIDFQYMTEIQARRCLDYLDGARYVLAGNLKKVASTMYLLTPINVVVNIEDLKLPEELQAGEFDFDMKRR
ncbi:cell division protein SepF [Streptococcus himalayensis]|uniref:Cell division protein SepF n=1 Tax=Streptococcus himalayensis TaxID=1888195 RepID=A0A917EH58_9STRE|nr:cell division protein SepF [Streptococcus himalayensis]GGE34210.1 cell division protein SepF [Streptococcus himalayensis]